MARPRTFDEETVLSGAMHVFRRQGYTASSVRDLEEATGLTSGSLYNTYGDKRGLFRAASDHYNRKVLMRRLQDHAPKGSGIEGLRRLFLSLLHEPDGGSSGCLITNSAVEFGDTEIPPFVTHGFDLLREAFADRLSGDGPDAVGLLALYQGVLVLVRAGYETRDLEKMITNHFSILEACHGR